MRQDQTVTQVSVGHPLGWEWSLLTVGWLGVRGQTWGLLLQHKAGGCFYKARGHKHPASAFGAAAPEGRSLVQGCELGFLFLAPALMPRHTSPSSSKSQMWGAPTTASAPHVHTGAA